MCLVSFHSGIISSVHLSNVGHVVPPDSPYVGRLGHVGVDVGLFGCSGRARCIFFTADVQAGFDDCR
jgi:hypothetical protein